MLRDDQIDKLSDLFLDFAKGLFLAGFALQIFTQSDIISFWKYYLTGATSAFFAIKVLELKKR